MLQLPVDPPPLPPPAGSPDPASVTPARVAPIGVWRTLRLATEFAVLFAGLPFLFIFTVEPGTRQPLFLLLWVGAALCWLAVRRDPTFDRAALWRVRGLRQALPGILLRWSLAAAALSALVLLIRPEAFLAFPTQRPERWLMVCTLYPLFSVLPQGIIYRSFLMHRYAPLFPGKWTMLVASSCAFAIGHAIFRNELAVALTLAGGFLFGWTYMKTRSGLIASIEHALYGNLIWTVGLGSFLFLGAVRG
jgi:membrane protease YdiL (CAAX protease family)